MLCTDPNYPLSKDFKLFEFLTSQTASRRGIVNIPTVDVVVRLERLVDQVIQPARNALGPIRISSGYRCPALNRAVGGSRNSQHMVGEAADLLPLKCSVKELLWYIQHHLPHDQLINEYNYSWCHVSLKQSGNRKQVFSIG